MNGFSISRSEVKIVFVLSIISCLLLPLPVGVCSKEKKADLISGRWNMTMETSDGYYRTPVEFIVDPDGQVRFTLLGSLSSLEVTSGVGRLSGNRLSLDATTPIGQLQIQLTISGDKLRGTWEPTGLARFFFNGNVYGERDRTARATVKSRKKVFEAVWEQIYHRFYDASFNGLDWQAARSRYAPRIDELNTDAELVVAVRLMLSALQSSHLDFFATSGQQDSWQLKGGGEAKALTWRRLSSTIGYLQINSFAEDPQSLADADHAFEQLDRLRSLVIDIRGNGGGSFGLALRIGDHILDSEHRVGYFVTRKGLDKRNVRSIDQIDPASLPIYSSYDSESFRKVLDSSGGVMLATGGRAAKAYRGRVVLLIDEHCYSAAEAFASAIKESHAATLIGRRTAGQMLGADYIQLPYDWVLVMPIMDFRTAGGVRVEGVGAEPDIAVKPTDSADPILARALEFLKE